MAVVPKFRMIGNASESFHHPQVSLPDDEREERGGKEMGNLPLFWSSSYFLQSPSILSLYVRGEKYFRENFKFPPNLILPTNLFMEKFHLLPSFYTVFHSTNYICTEQIVFQNKCRKSSTESFAITAPSYCSCKMLSFLVSKYQFRVVSRLAGG